MFVSEVTDRSLKQGVAILEPVVFLLRKQVCHVHLSTLLRRKLLWKMFNIRKMNSYLAELFEFISWNNTWKSNCKITRYAISYATMTVNTANPYSSKVWWPNHRTILNHNISWSASRQKLMSIQNLDAIFGYLDGHLGFMSQHFQLRQNTTMYKSTRYHFSNTSKYNTNLMSRGLIQILLKYLRGKDT